MDLHQFITASHDQDDLVDKLNRYIQSLPLSPTLADELSTLAPPNSDNEPVYKVFALEALMYHTEIEIDHQKVDNLLKQLATIALKSSNCLSLLRIKYLDLLTDYQLLFSPDVRELKLIDLVSKKINFLSAEDDSLPLVRDIQFKVLIYYLLCGSDFRKKNIHKYLSDEEVFLREFPVAIQKYLACCLTGGLIPTEAYSELVSHLNESVEFQAVFSRHRGHLMENFVETNLEKLPKYFKSIRLTRINSLLGVGSTVDIEDLLFRMITTKKFTSPTTIDQIEGIVEFGDLNSKYDPFNSHIKKVCDLVETLTQ